MGPDPDAQQPFVLYRKHPHRLRHNPHKKLQKALHLPYQPQQKRLKIHHNLHKIPAIKKDKLLEIVMDSRGLLRLDYHRQQGVFLLKPGLGGGASSYDTGALHARDVGAAVGGG